ncbi:MAG: prepilin-type N-terminal cleavage/methylation domain-containing protein [Candidatus Thiodiazotropha sp. (ex Monitilora ramsayi)]|nr:prepilin-type N-terminal cleavage/methylation domain-containing protein [Candidatus Thiodiazotropha sp. (ex Monitilora ramsayi)]
MKHKQRFKPGCTTSGGLSLIEVLVAFVILSMVMSVIMRINATSLRNHNVSSQYLQAVQVVQSRMVEMGIDDQSEHLVSEGIEPGGINWHYVRQPYLEWSETRFQSAPLVPVEERITISWGGDETREETPRQLTFSRVSLITASR